MRSKLKQLHQSFDPQDEFLNEGHQIVKARAYPRKPPLWAMSDTKIRQLILRSFPKAHTSDTQRAAAGRWASVIHLYFRMGYTRPQIAHEIGSTTTKVHGIIRSILRVSKGLRANGQGKLKGSRGRPKNVPHIV